MTEQISRPGLKDLINQLNRPGDMAIDGIPIEQDWLEALRNPFNPEANIHVQAMATLMDEIGRLRNRLALSESRRAELEQLIDTDPMCPVLNRRAFERELSRAIAWARRSNRPGSVLFLDMNGLKKLNDTYGHAVGDLAIERLARTLILSCRTTDLIGRMGGDEFAVLMPDTPPAGARVRGDRVAELLARVPFITDEATLYLGVAYGAAAFDGNDTAREVLARADAAMYAHKQEQKGNPAHF